MNEDEKPPPVSPPRALLKIGGEVVADAVALASLLAQVRRLTQHGWQWVVVHGAGPQANELQRRLGLTPQMVGGRRVTDAATLQIVKQVLGGEVNLDVVASALGQGLKAVGLSAGAAGMVTATRRPPSPVPGEPGTVIDYGFVGEVDAIDPSLVEDLWRGGYTPILHPVCMAAEGSAHGPPQIFNVNADTVAAELAHALRVDHLFLVTSVPGVLRDREDLSSRIEMLTPKSAKAAIEAGVIVGGMIPKVLDVLALLGRGIGAVHILGPSGEALAGEALHPGSFGTVLRADEAGDV